jgi:hypothetical protein
VLEKELFNNEMKTWVNAVQKEQAPAPAKGRFVFDDVAPEQAPAPPAPLAGQGKVQLDIIDPWDKTAPAPATTQNATNNISQGESFYKSGQYQRRCSHSRKRLK